MSFYHFKAKFVSKASQSAVAKAAYVSNDALYSERDEETKKYKTRTVKPESFIIAPSHAPEWVYDRERLWNEVEKIEKPYNAQVLREVTVALPIELSKEEQSDLVREFVQENFVSDGMVADVNIHRDQQHNPHAHILLTVRPFKENGEWYETKTKKQYIVDKEGQPVLNEKGNQKTRNIDLTGWNSKEKLVSWRENFAEKINDFYKRKGIDKTVSHLSYKDQGKVMQAKHRLTRNEYYVEKKAKEEALKNNKEYVPVTTFGKLNKEIEEFNNEIASVQKQIDDLEKSKHNIIPFDVEAFSDIRRNYKMETGDQEAIKFVQGRQKVQHIDFKDSQKAVESLEYWKRNIDKKFRGLEREEKALKTVKDMYQKQNESIKRYGFVMDGFASRFNDKMLKLNDQYERLKEEFISYKDSYKLAKHAHDIQRDLLKKEFEFLYPEYADLTEIESFDMYELMHKHVSLYKENETIVESISELDSYEQFPSKEEQKFRDNVWDLVVDYRNQSKMYFSLPKKLSALEKDYLDSVKNLNAEDKNLLDPVYEKAINYLKMKNELTYINQQYEGTRNKMFETLIELYGEEQKDVIEKIPDRVKASLLENFLMKREVNELHVDLESVKNKIDRADYTREPFNREWEGKSNFKAGQPEAQSSQSMGGILSDMIEAAKQNENKYDDLESKRKRAKRRMRKLTKEEKLEMEKG